MFAPFISLPMFDPFPIRLRTNPGLASWTSWHWWLKTGQFCGKPPMPFSKSLQAVSLDSQVARTPTTIASRYHLPQQPIRIDWLAKAVPCLKVLCVCFNHTNRQIETKIYRINNYVIWHDSWQWAIHTNQKQGLSVTLALKEPPYLVSCFTETCDILRLCYY